ncbi:MAG: class I SAM-dependent methyltransferase [Phycisphaerae bacterium]|nr:class I SAM-dependent methyltransferase [Phycisphaerae bacterium]
MFRVPRVKYLRCSLIAVVAACGPRESAQAPSPAPPPAPPTASALADPYTYAEASADGTGKFYLGREISVVMGHLAAGWLERPGREREERTDLVFTAMELRPGDVVADIGAGTGYFSFPIGRIVSEGKVLAVDIQPEMLAIVRDLAAAKHVDNIEPVLGAVDDVNIPANTVDVVLLVDAYHEFSHPKEMLDSIMKALRPGGRVIQIEYRAEDPDVPIKPLHKMSEGQARKEMSAAGFEWVETKSFLPQQHFMVFRRPQ